MVRKTCKCGNKSIEFTHLKESDLPPNFTLECPLCESVAVAKELQETVELLDVPEDVSSITTTIGEELKPSDNPKRRGKRAKGGQNG